MKEVLNFIQNKKQDFAQLPLFEFMKDSKIDPRQRLSFAPCGAHFVMSFADLNKYIFREYPPCNQLQELINEHTYEDDHHLVWFLEDLEKLGFAHSLSFPDALRFLWGEQTKHTRQLSYRLAGYALQSDPLRKLVVIETIEAMGNVFFSCTTQVALELQEITQIEYRYFGSVHLNVENGHTTGKTRADKLLEDIQLTEESRQEAFELVEKVFQVFTELANELLEYAKTQKISQQIKAS
ncbi:hypothetical protein H6F98_00475 [Microcoleus sp. FACHB-SPT15]|uniref:hypothetical protein n=1 Tax=Microcoleus sp. FACHB-SPT15 TaxID=2692830 RepID=UPI00177EE5BE|nr:hypothetical protein [Microcoleus sp. FACHB-SPT15]MBD1803953.1 hypothetical protein [Microcoleus sp. FACHB-SPT15]